MVQIGGLIKDFRQRAGLSQSELARAIKSTKSTISKYELGRREPSLETIQKIANALGVAFWELLDLQATPNFPEIIEDYKSAEREGKKVILRNDGIYVIDLTTQEKLNKAFALLNDDGQQEAVKRVEELTEIPRYQRQGPQDGPDAPDKGEDTLNTQGPPETPTEGK